MLENSGLFGLPWSSIDLFVHYFFSYRFVVCGQCNVISIIGHCIVCPPSIYGFWLSPFGIFKRFYVPPQRWKNKRIVKPSSVCLCWLLCAFQSISQKFNIFCFARLWHLTRLWRVTRMCSWSRGGRTTPERSMRLESLSFWCMLYIIDVCLYLFLFYDIVWLLYDALTT